MSRPVGKDCRFRRNASRTNRLIRLRITAPPTFRVTVTPSRVGSNRCGESRVTTEPWGPREGPALALNLGATNTRKCRVWCLSPERCTRRNSLRRRSRNRRGSPSDVICGRCSPTGACDRASDERPGFFDRCGWPCAPGTHAFACGGSCEAGTCASRRKLLGVRSRPPDPTWRPTRRALDSSGRGKRLRTSHRRQRAWIDSSAPEVCQTGFDCAAEPRQNPA